ncbi:amidohydrolase family protein [Mucilaginibacter sp. L3T2-6]|uniref:amidohydrolase family protein n=1 Tax=Mucilaginibacter sp. L3T2-6 TaxID=3062491 RepID=UPI002675B1B5|nr:amidohydrolase family protein [Mucilaginibacter sp. L3T2-6]MDO3645323.1 amidohydrolase family protein [Mucilaginibacter sp. L3T2-6]MDV6217822.1 amidohydrolase family protein [Mucilaginibacter sp. L3T2-6]
MKPWLLPLLVFFYSHSQAQYAPRALALTDATIIDADHRAPLRHQTILICKGRITEVFPEGTKKLPDTATIINLSGKYVLPGLIDAHVHLATDPSGTDNREHTLNVLKQMLCSGVTAVRDMAGDARVLAGLSRDAQLGEIPAPDICYSALMAGSVFFSDPRTASSTQGGSNGNMPYMQAITGGTDFKLAVAQAKGSGAAGIKLYANLSAGQVNEIMAEARRQHIPVWGHAWLQEAKPSDLVKAGLLSLSHVPLLIREKIPQIPADWKKGTHSPAFWDEATPDLDSLFVLMKAHHTILDATLLTYKDWAGSDSTARWAYETGRRLLARAYRAGVTICAGTDVDQKAFVQAEMEVLVRDAGLSTLDAIIAATRNSACAAGLDSRKGLVKSGMDADLLILSVNPLESIANIKKVFLVIKGGRLYAN